MHCRPCYCGLIVLAGWFFAHELTAQTLRCLVSDGQTGDPLVGACINLIELGSGECSDASGVITLSGLSFPVKGVVGYIGYNDQEIFSRRVLSRTGQAWIYRSIYGLSLGLESSGFRH